MGDPIVTRRIQCDRCGAAHQVLDGALLVVCEYCGAFVALQTAELWGGEAIARRHAQSLRALVEPSAADARKLEAQLAMSEAQARDDRPAWRLWAREFYAMLATTDPELVLGDPDDPRQRARWVQHSLQAAELSTFDPAIQAAQHRYATAAGGLYGGADVMAVARDALRRAEELYAAMFEHPEYPPELAAGDPAHMARELLRSAVIGAATMLGPGIVHRIRHEVLGDEAIDEPEIQCRGCGAQLSLTPGSQRCPHCGAVLEVDTEDPWLTNMVGLWQASRAQATDDAAEALASLTLALSSYFSRKTLPPIDSLRRFLVEGPGWLSREALLGAIELMGHGYGSEPPVMRWLDEVRVMLDHWVPRGERPAPTPRRDVIPPEAPLAVEHPADDPWVRQSLALWEHSRGSQALDPSSLPTTTIGFVLSPFYLGGSISVAQALAFIGAVEPRASAAALADAADLMREAAATPEAAPLLAALAAALRSDPT